MPRYVAYRTELILYLAIPDQKRKKRDNSELFESVNVTAT